MSFAGPVNLLNHMVKEDFNIKLLKNHLVTLAKQENILKNLVFIATFEEISDWVFTHSHGQKYIANPANASDTDRLDCLFAIQEPLALALKKIEIRRKNGRDRRLIEAAEVGDYGLIADILASTASTYWRDHGFLNSSKELKIASFLKNNEKNLEKKEFQKAQLDHIGATVGFEKAHKKGAFQEILDFEETEVILKNNYYED